MSNKTTQIQILAAVAILATLLVSGVIGPRRLRRAIVSLNRWIATKATLYFPIDPYKPIGKATKQAIRHYWPTKERYRNWLFVEIAGFLIVVAVVLLVLAVSSLVARD